MARATYGTIPAGPGAGRSKLSLAGSSFVERGQSHTQHVEPLGEVEALSRLMVSADLPQGFRALRDSGQLDQTFEAVVVRFPAFFRDDVVQAAQWRLDNPHDLL